MSSIQPSFQQQAILELPRNHFLSLKNDNLIERSVIIKKDKHTKDFHFAD